jgi:hypothetical protein
LQVAELITAIATAVIALVAVVISIIEARAARQHNRLSVRPHVSVRHHLGGSTGRLGITASNDGLGPALVNACVVEVDGTPMQEGEGNDNGWNAALKALDLYQHKFAIEVVAPNGTIPAGGTRWLLSAPFPPATAALPDQMKKAFKRLDVRLSYQSMYRGENLIANYRTEKSRQVAKA